MYVLLHSLFAAVSLATSSPSLQWASQPTLAGETLMLWGDSLSTVSSLSVTPVMGPGAANASSSSVSVPTFDTSPTSLKAILPPSLPHGVYRVCVGASACITVNAPDIWWWRGDVNLTFATPGGWIRVFGRLTDEKGRLPTPSLSLQPATNNTRGGSALLSATNFSANSAWYESE